MKPQSILLSIVMLVFICSACGNKNNSTNQAYTRPYPHIDTVKIGLHSDSGHYALLTYYLKYVAKDTSFIEGAEFTQLGNEKWKVITLYEQRN